MIDPRNAQAWLNFLWWPSDPMQSMNDYLTYIEEYATLRSTVPGGNQKWGRSAATSHPPLEVYDDLQ